MNSKRDVLRFCRIQRCAVAALMLVPIMGLMPQQSNAEGINWTIAPYLWATDVGLDVTINNNPAIGASVPFNDLVDKLDGALMGHIEMSGEKYGAFADIYYVNLTENEDTHQFDELK